MTPRWYSRPLAVGDQGDDVAIIQRKLGLYPSGEFDYGLESVVRGVQKMAKVKDTGVVDAPTAEAIGESVVTSITPEWFVRELHLGFAGEDVESVNRRLFVHPEGRVDNRFTHDTEAAVRRLQSANDISPNGVIDETTAILIGDFEQDR